MKNASDGPQGDLDELRQRILGLGDRSLHRSYFSELQKRNRELQESEYRYRSLVENLNVGVYRATADCPGQCLEMNAAGARILGAGSVEEILARPVASLYVDPSERPRLMELLARNGEVRNQEIHVRRLDGTTLWMNWSGVLHRDAGGKPQWVYGVFEDQSDRKAAEVALQKTMKELEAASAAKDRFLAVLSHELRTPLNPVVLLLEAMEGDSRIPEDRLNDLRLIRNAVELESRLIDDLLDLGRIAAGKLNLRRENLDIHEAIRNALKVCEHDIQGAGLRLAIDLRAQRHHTTGDAARLQQIFWNLFKNAAKFTPAGGYIRVSTRNEEDGQTCVTEVADTGTGISAESLRRIFEMFEQGEDMAAQQRRGLGVGLTIARTIAELHGGSILAASEGLGKGSVFTVRLPCRSASVVATRPEGPSDSPPAGLRVLLIEDNAPSAAVLARLLRNAGDRVRVAVCLEEAKALIRQGGFDVALSDLGLPDGSGLELGPLLRERGIPAIATTGFGMEKDIEATREAGFASHLTKPLTLAAVRAAIANAMSPVH